MASTPGNFFSTRPLQSPSTVNRQLASPLRLGNHTNRETLVSDSDDRRISVAYQVTLANRRMIWVPPDGGRPFWCDVPGSPYLTDDEISLHLGWPVPWPKRGSP